MPWKCKKCGSYHVHTLLSGHVEFNRTYQMKDGVINPVGDDDINDFDGEEEVPMECADCNDSAGFIRVEDDGTESK
jgi:hypothetical protein